MKILSMLLVCLMLFGCGPKSEEVVKTPVPTDVGNADVISYRLNEIDLAENLPSEEGRIYRLGNVYKEKVSFFWEKRNQTGIESIPNTTEGVFLVDIKTHEAEEILKDTVLKEGELFHFVFALENDLFLYGIEKDYSIVYVYMDKGDRSNLVFEGDCQWPFVKEDDIYLLLSEEETGETVKNLTLLCIEEDGEVETITTIESGETRYYRVLDVDHVTIVAEENEKTICVYEDGKIKREEWSGDFQVYRFDDELIRAYGSILDHPDLDFYFTREGDEKKYELPYFACYLSLDDFLITYPNIVILVEDMVDTMEEPFFIFQKKDGKILRQRVDGPLSYSRMIPAGENSALLVTGNRPENYRFHLLQVGDEE